MPTIIDDIDLISTYSSGNFVSHAVESIDTMKTFYVTDFLGAVTEAFLYVFCSVDISAGDPTITFGKPGFEAPLPAPTEIFAKSAFLSPRPATEETRNYRFDVTSVVDSPGSYNISGSALSGSNIYFGATLYVVYEYANDIGPLTISTARTRVVSEYGGMIKIT
jgi:hypothetical protein